MTDEAKMQNRQIIMEFIRQCYDLSQQHLLNKCYSILTHILKFDLNEKNWPNFFDDYFEAASINPINFLQFLAFFTQIAMNESGDAITSNRASEIILILTSQLERILAFVNKILTETTDISIIKAALPTLSIFVAWLPPNFVFESPIFKVICTHFLLNQELVISSCDVLLEFLRTIIPFPEFVPLITNLFSTIITSLEKASNHVFSSLPLKTVISYLGAFEKCLSMFTTIFNQPEIEGPLNSALTFLMQITIMAEEDHLLENCFNVWMLSYNKLLSCQVCADTQNIFRRFMSPLRRVVLSKIPKPYFFNEFIDEHGIQSNQFQSKALCDSLFIIIRECFVFLTNVDKSDTISLLNEKLTEVQQQMNQTNQNLCVEDVQQIAFAIALTAGTFGEQIENNVILPMIHQFFSIASNTCDPNPETRIAITCGLVYLCSQYYTLLNRFSPLLKAVFQLVKKILFEKNNEELQSVSVFALKTMSRFCKAHFMNPLEGEDKSFLNELLDNSPRIFASLSSDNIVEMFKAIAIIIRSFPDESTRFLLLSRLIQGIGAMWNHATTPSFDPFNDDSCRILTIVLQCHSSILLSLCVSYFEILENFLPDLLNIVSIVSQAIPNAQNEMSLNLMKSVKSNIFDIIYRFTCFCYRQDIIVSFIIPSTFDLILYDYISSSPQFRLKMSLKYFVTVFTRCSGVINEKVFNSFDQIYQCTLPTITNNYSDNENIRYDFFYMMGVMIHSYSSVLVKQSTEYIDIFINTLKFGAEHTKPDICEMCIELLSDIFGNFKAVMENQNRFNEFYDRYCLRIVQFFFEIMVNLSYKFAFTQESFSIKSVFGFENMKNKAPEVFDMICNMFPSVNPGDIGRMIQTLMSDDFLVIKKCLRDFLYQVKIMMPNDPDLYKSEILEMKEQLKKPFENLPGFIIEQEQSEEDEAPKGLVEDISSMSIRNFG